MYDFLDDPDPAPATIRRSGPHEHGPGLEGTLRQRVERVLTDDFRRRLQRAEVEVDLMTQAEREGVLEWLGSMLHRPPLERPSRAWRPMRALVEALWWDLADRTPADPMDPDAGNPRLVPNHPWGEGHEPDPIPDDRTSRAMR
jgi:hypothetical protein